MSTEYKNKLLAFYHSKKRMPTYTEMLKLFGFKSKNSIARLVDKFIDAGIVEKDYLGRITPSREFGQVAMLGSVTAGLPASVEATERETHDTVSLDDFLVEKKDLTYILEVDGDSMIDAHIAKGDLVVVERRDHAKDGEIVVAEVDGEFTMKYFRIASGKTWLEPANKNYKPIYPEYDLKVTAVVKAVIRKY